MKFLYKTRASTDPKGKPKVYFTCHPEDFSKYFQKLSDDILEAQDCAVYYTEDMEGTIDALEQELSLKQMNLFVVPVTFKLLNTPNRAMREDIAYAKENHIPILPFMMEPHIDHLYSRPDKFGERQYLHPDSSDKTQVPYKDKLKNHLNSVFISSEMVSRIKKEFDAYVFLSYRKKDRYYANSLLKTIHDIPRFRDTAIWYDEFLTPGESFRENISHIMNNSRDFLLLVTPNLLEENNYVRNIEYPMAQKANIPIVPIEMVKTDRSALSQAFKGIPECIDPADTACFSEKMLASFPTLSQLDPKKGPEHLFLIGLAYLQGIDVEVNHARAFELMTAAAEAGYTEAIEKLYRLYSGEDGNAFINHTKALKWGERIVQDAQQHWGPEHPNTLTAMAKLAATLSGLRQYDKAAEILETVCRVRSKVLGQDHPMTVTSMHNLVVELCHLGDYQRALEIGEIVYQDRCQILGETHPDTIITLHNLAQAYIGLDDLKKAAALVEKAYGQSKAVAGEYAPDTLRILESLADIYCKLGEHQKGIDLFASVYDARTKQYGKASRQACNTLLDLAVIRCKNGDYTNGFQHFDEAVALYSQMFGPQSKYVEVAISKADDLGFSACTARAVDAAALFWGKALELRKKAFGVWDSQAISMLNSLVDILPDLDSPEKKEAVLDHLFDTLMTMRNTIYYGTYGGERKDGFTQMHKLMLIYSEHYQNLQKYVALLEMFYQLCRACYGANATVTVKYKQALDHKKAQLV